MPANTFPANAIDLIEKRLDELIERYQLLLNEHKHLVSDHEQLCQQQQQWHKERARLMEKQEIARARIDAMIKQLKKLEVIAQ